MITRVKETTTLSNGVQMPWLGLGVWRTKEGTEVENAVKYALQAGYRSIDTAMIYENECGVGKAIQESGVPRREIFVTTKLWNKDQGYESTLAAFEESRSKLGLEVIDLYLIHWAVKDKFLDTWRAFEKLYQEGKVRAIGVSNFQIHHLEEILSQCQVKPMVNQVEYHPYLTQKELHTFCKENNIQLEAWSPLMQGTVGDEPVLVQLGEKHGKTPAQIVLRWNLQNEVVTIPKSVREHRIIENAGIFDFELSAEDMESIDQLNRNHRFGPDPDNFNF